MKIQLQETKGDKTTGEESKRHEKISETRKT